MRAQVTWEASDRHRVLTVGGVIGLVLAIGVAVWGLPPVDLHGPLHRLGIMDPLCGGTRSAYLAMRGDWARAWTYNPLGILTVVAAVVTTLRLLVGLVARRWITISVTWGPRGKAVALAVAAVLATALEVRQQLNAELLIAGL